MAQLTTSPRGMQDVLGEESYRWRYVEKKLADICERFQYKEVRVPTFEHTELFARGVGDSTDVVNKEMYTMLDKGARSITLRPEGTSGVARALIQHGALSGLLPSRSYYIMSCFRYEKPQAGRLREFHQLGIELFGCAEADADAEVIRAADVILRELGVKNVALKINSIGCPQCRARYREALKAYFAGRSDALCDTCKERLERSPMRILDCKDPRCQAASKDAPVMLDYLCDDCAAHLEALKGLLAAAGIAYEIDARIVRGLDYYTRTVFEFVHTAAGAQGTVCGGGRYDGLARLLGGPDTPAVGFGMGIERLLAVMDAEGIVIPPPEPPELFIAYIGERGRALARSLTVELQNAGRAAYYDICGRSVKAQMKYADKTGARYTLAIGDDEAASGEGRLKRMSDGAEFPAPLDAARLAAAICEITQK